MSVIFKRLSLEKSQYSSYTHTDKKWQEEVINTLQCNYTQGSTPSVGRGAKDVQEPDNITHLGSVDLPQPKSASSTSQLIPRTVNQTQLRRKLKAA